VRAEHWLRQATAVSAQALAEGALVPLQTRLHRRPELSPFVLRELISRPPRHLRPEGPKPNPFLPWDQPLEVAKLGDGHVLLLNKYPVEPSHLLVITQGWQPQAGWVQPLDWAAVATVAADTGGLWFFNSGATAGASQPHRHLQLLPRRAEEPSCPLAPLLRSQLAGQSPAWPWAYQLSARWDPLGGSDLEGIYRRHCLALELGSPSQDDRPWHPYNLVFDDDWFLTVRRVQEHGAGFSVNGLGFAGYLLSTDNADRAWLERHGPWALLGSVAAMGPGGVDRSAAKAPPSNGEA
jgi:ATP adenylyltransferase